MKILVSIIGYKEADLAGTVKDCYDKAKNKNNLIFSVVEEHDPSMFANLDFIPNDQLIHRCFDLSKYRGILWARSLTTKNNADYDYVLYICGHTRFEKDWDEICLNAYNNVLNKNNIEKAIISFHAPLFEVNEDGTLEFDKNPGPKVNTYYPRLEVTKDFGYEFTPGYWFPDVTEVPIDTEFTESYWINFTWCFASKDFVYEVPFDTSIGWTAEEIYCSIQAWCRGWRIFAIPNIIYRHHTVRKYPGDKDIRNNTHRPWADKNKDSYWENADASILKLNRLLSSTLDQNDKFFISKEKILEYCKNSGLNIKYTKYDPEYHMVDKYQQNRHLRNAPPVERI